MENASPILMTAADAEALGRILRRRFVGAGGVEVAQTDSVVTITLRGRGGEKAPAVLKYKAAITGSAAHPTAPDRFVYAHAELRKIAPGPSGWTILAGGRSGTVTENAAYNWAEGNYAGRLASGILKTNLPSTFVQPPVPNNSVVDMEVHQNPDGTAEYWFERGTIPDGVCP